MDGKAQQTFNDPLYSGQYYHRLIMANRLNNFPMIDNSTADSRTIVVAVVEQAININTTDVNWYKNINEIANNGIDDDNNGFVDDYDGWRSVQEDDDFGVITNGIHGKNCSGIIGAFANNNTGCVGVAPGVSILPVQGESNNMVEALEYVLAQRQLYNQTNGVKGAFVVACNL
ncbi:MAG: S8 family serine peptidase [Bacteroidia bacterium]|nr:S8 family serine peptidase [Bacteroidia bacterium]